MVMLSWYGRRHKATYTCVVKHIYERSKTMRDINVVVDSKMKAIQVRTGKLHAQLDAAIHSECSGMSTPAVPKQRRRVVRTHTPTPTCGSGIGTGMIGMAYRALTSDPTLRLVAKDIEAVHIQAWLDSEYCTTVEVADVQVAMLEYKHTR